MWSPEGGVSEREVLYQLDHVSRVYVGASPVYALRDCVMIIESADFLAVTGTSGSGKSTLLNLLGLVDAPTSGRILLNGQDVGCISDAQRTRLRSQVIGFVFQSFHLLPHRTLVENVCLPLLYQRIPSKTARKRAADTLTRVGLGGRLESTPAQLSGGQAQRVAIARAVAARPQVILCDEPTGNLDQANSEQVIALLHELNADGLTIVIVTHDAAIARQARRIVRVSDGYVSGE